MSKSKLGSKKTHKSDIRKELREYPYARGCHEHGDDVEYQPYKCDCKEKADEAEHDNTEVPHTQTEDGRPEGKHDCGKDNQYHACTADIRDPLRALVEPRKVPVFLEGLHRVHLEVLWRLGPCRRLPALHEEEESIGHHGAEQRGRLCFILNLWHIF